MAKDLMISSGLRDYILLTGSVEAALDLGAIQMYTGTIPASADAAETGTQLVELTTDGLTLAGGGTNGLGFEATLTSGSLVKDTGETWQGTPSNSGGDDVTYWRWVKDGDTGTTSTSEIRIQGTAGLLTDPGDLILSDLAITHNVLFTLPSFVFRLPRFRSEL